MDFYELINQHNVLVYLLAAWFMVISMSVGDVLINRRKFERFDLMLLLFGLYFAGGLSAVFDTSIFMSFGIGIANYPLLRIILDNRKSIAEKIARAITQIEFTKKDDSNGSLK